MPCALDHALVVTFVLLTTCLVLTSSKPICQELCAQSPSRQQRQLLRENRCHCPEKSHAETVKEPETTEEGPTTELPTTMEPDDFANFTSTPDSRGVDVTTANLTTITTTDSRATTHKQSDTYDICEALCSVQLGGDACNCNSPSLPGK